MRQLRSSRMRDLAVQASNASLSSTERGYLDAEQAKLATTLDSVIVKQVQ